MADKFQFMCMTVSGDGSVVARIKGYENTDDFVMAGVMVRASLEPGSRFAFSRLLRTGYRARINVRLHDGASAQWGAITGPLALPRWVKVSKVGERLTSYHSPDGVVWTKTGTIVQDPLHGTLSGIAPDLTYQPGDSFNGSDSFTFKVNDGEFDSNVAMIFLTIESVVGSMGVDGLDGDWPTQLAGVMVGLSPDRIAAKATDQSVVVEDFSMNLETGPAGRDSVITVNSEDAAGAGEVQDGSTAAMPVPGIIIERVAPRRIRIVFTGVLQHSLNGEDWIDVYPQPGSPWTIRDQREGAFYRAR